MGLYSSFVKSVTYPIWLRYDGQPETLKWLSKFEESQYFTRERLDELRWARLKQILEHAFSNSPYYRKMFEEAGWSANTFKDYSDIRKIPVLTKATLIDHCDDLVAANLARGALHRAASGGSTGRRTPFYRDNSSRNPKLAAEWRFQKWSGWDLGEITGLLWPARQDLELQPTWRSTLRNRTSQRQILLSAGAMTEESMESFALRIQKQRVAYLKGFTNAVYLFCQYCAGRFQFPRLRSVICTGEPVLVSQRNLIERSLCVPVFDYYCCRELGPISSECEVHNGLHLNEESLYVEVENDPLTPGSAEGSLLVTDLNNYGMPFIRYRLGDRAQLLRGNCRCGRTLGLMSNPAGRTTDFLVSTHGEKVHGASLVHYVLAMGFDVGQVQFVQRQPGRIIVRTVNRRNIDERAWLHLDATLRTLLGSDIKIEREDVAEIPMEVSGKHRVTICEITPAP